MPSFKALVENKQDLKLDVPGGESVQVTINPSLLTVAFEEDMSTKALTTGSRAFLEKLSELIIDWDVTDEKGKTLDINPDNLALIPVPFLTRILSEAFASQRVGEASGGTSRQR